jgi:magnesium transporter
MRLLTIFTVILLPLALIAGIYGMNGIDLQNITQIPLGFLVVLATMAFMVAVLILFFIKKRWIILGRENSEKQSKSVNKSAA